MKRQFVGFLAGVVAIGGVVVASQVGPASADTTLNLRLKESLCGADRTYCKRLDHNALGSFGDSLVFSLPLKYRSDGRRAGRDEGECVTLDKVSGQAYCTFVAHSAERNGGCPGFTGARATPPSRFCLSRVAQVLMKVPAATGNRSAKGGASY